MVLGATLVLPDQRSDDRNPNTNIHYRDHNVPASTLGPGPAPEPVQQQLDELHKAVYFTTVLNIGKLIHILMMDQLLNCSMSYLSDNS